LDKAIRQAKSITFVVPFTAAAPMSLHARSQKTGASLGAQIVIDNKTGAGGTVGAGFGS
jgi:tripartite-type tricarboxylate transporter receptor subunit TctC